MTAVHERGVMPLGSIQPRKIVNKIIKAANEPAQRFKLLWYGVAWALAGVYFFIGVGYAGAGSGVIQSKALNVAALMEGNLHVHGFIMIGVAVLLTYGLSDYRRVTRWALLLYMFYSTWTLTMILIGWAFYGITWGAPWWYLLTSFLSGYLVSLAPPLNKDGSRYAGAPEGSDSA